MPTERAVSIVVAGLVAIALAACGSSKPAYCSTRSSLESSIKGLTNLNASSGISGLQAQVKKIQSDATNLVNQAKSDFPNETSAISSSVSKLQSSVSSLASSPSASQIASVTTAASGLVTSVQSFVNSSKSKCS